MSTRKRYEDLKFTDDFMFCKVLENNPDLCKRMLELILGVKIKKIQRSESQLSIKHTFDGKGVRFDVYIEDTQDSVYDIEMQTTIKKEIPKRARYYQGMIDLNLLKEGIHYSELKKTYIIFICLDDPFGKNLPVYTFEYACVDNPHIKLNDEAVKVVINANGDRTGLSDEMVAFLDFLKYNKADSKLTEDLRYAVNRSIAKKEWEGEFMTLEMKIQEEREEAKAEGLAEVRTTVIRNMLAQGFEHELIAKICDCDIDLVKELVDKQ